MHILSVIIAFEGVLPLQVSAKCLCPMTTLYIWYHLIITSFSCCSYACWWTNISKLCRTSTTYYSCKNRWEFAKSSGSPAYLACGRFLLLTSRSIFRSNKLLNLLTDWFSTKDKAIHMAVQQVCSPSSFLFPVVMPGAPSSVLAPSSDARSP